MAIDSDIPEESLRNRYEVRDANLPHLLIFGAIMAVTLIVVAVVVWALFHVLARMQAEEGPAQAAFQNVQTLPPQPRLQPDPAVDLEHLRADEESKAGQYGWVDKQQGRVRIPVDRAMDLAIDRHIFQSRSGPEPGAYTPTPPLGRETPTTQQLTTPKGYTPE
jgi:hypothetical protein